MASPIHKLTPVVELQMLEIRKPGRDQTWRQPPDLYSHQFMQESNKHEVTPKKMCSAVQFFMITKKAKQFMVLRAHNTKIQKGEKKNHTNIRDGKVKTHVIDEGKNQTSTGIEKQCN